MSVLSPAERRFGTILALIFLLVSGFFDAARADVPKLRHGVNFELWQHWTNREPFLAPGFDRSNFPDWQKAVDDRSLAALHQRGFDFVRLNVDPSPFFWDPSSSDRLLDAVVVAVRRLLDVGFDVVVDLHAVSESQDRPNGLHWILGTGDRTTSDGFSAHLALVRAFAVRLKGLANGRVALELLNEPDQDWNSHLTLQDRWPAQLKALHAAARRVAPELPLVLSGARGGGVEGLLRLDPSAFDGDDAIVWSFHLYEPMALTHAGLPWESGPAHFLTGMPFPASALDAPARGEILARAGEIVGAEIADPAKRAAMSEAVAVALDRYVATGASPATIDAEIRKVADWAKSHAIRPERILLGEFGGYREGMAPGVRPAIVRATRLSAEKAGFAWAIYTAGLTQARHSFGILDDAGAMRLEPALSRALGLE